MKLYHHLEELGHVPNPVVTTGTFDGVHIGHRTIINRLKELAAQTDGETVIFTFHPHPRMVLFPDDHGLQLLNTQAEKIALLEKAGVDHLVIHPFTKDFSRLSAVDYVRDILVNGIGTKKLVIGYDHHFGRNREGSFDDLVDFGHTYDFELEEIPAQDIDSVNVSSTKIRHALAIGDVETATTYLGYHYPLTGQVAKGDGLGRTIGFPTANLQINDSTKLIPANGVYAVTVKVGGTFFNGVLNIGVRPTVNAFEERRIEVNLFDFSGDLYGKSVQVSFHHRIRDEQKFGSMEALQQQLLLDRETSYALLR